MKILTAQVRAAQVLEGTLHAVITCLLDFATISEITGMPSLLGCRTVRIELLES